MSRCRIWRFIVCCDWRGRPAIQQYAWLMSILHFSIMQLFAGTQTYSKPFTFKIKLIIFCIYCSTVSCGEYLIIGYVGLKTLNIFPVYINGNHVFVLLGFGLRFMRFWLRFYATSKFAPFGLCGTSPKSIYSDLTNRLHTIFLYFSYLQCVM